RIGVRPFSRRRDGGTRSVERRRRFLLHPIATRVAGHRVCLDVVDRRSGIRSLSHRAHASSPILPGGTAKLPVPRLPFPETTDRGPSPSRVRGGLCEEDGRPSFPASKYAGDEDGLRRRSQTYPRLRVRTSWLTAR